MFRLVVGFGVGGDYATSAVITAEYSNRRSRGRLVGTVFAMQGLGLLAGPLIASVFLGAGVPAGTSWRLMLGLGAIPAASVVYLRRKIRETPATAWPSAATPPPWPRPRAGPWAGRRRPALPGAADQHRRVVVPDGHRLLRQIRLQPADPQALLNSIHLRGVMAVMAAVSAVGILLTLIALPEPKGQTLEEASAETTPAVPVSTTA